MEPLSTASTVLSTIGSVLTTGYQIYDYIQAVKNAPTSARALETEVAALNVALDKIRQLLSKLDKEGKSTYANTSLLFRVVNGCQAEMDEIFTQLNHFRSPHRLSRIFHRLTWPLNEQDTTKAAEALHRYAQVFQLSLSTDAFTFLFNSCEAALGRPDEIHSSSAVIITDLDALRDQLAELGDGQRDRKFAEFVEWFPTIAYQDKHLYIQTHRLDGSGKWMLDSSTFQEWQDFATPRSTSSARAGLDCIVADHLQQRARSGACVAYFYFDYNYQDVQKPYFVTNVYIVLDALDECDATENRGPILEFVRKMIQSNVRLFATSRPFPQDILDAFEGTIPVDIEAASTDLRTYVLDVMSKSKWKARALTESLREKVVAKIVENSQGMFLLARFQINYVMSQNSPGEVEQSLKILPKGLYENFDITMARIEKLQYDHQVQFAKQTLLWITTAARPLSVAEIRHAIRISEAPNQFSLDTVPAWQLCVEYCLGFVVLDTKSDTVRLAHFSIDEYLRQRQFDFIASGQQEAAVACLNYIAMPWRLGTYQTVVEADDNGTDPDISHDSIWVKIQANLHYSSLTTKLDELRELLPFMDYATAHWGDHAAKAWTDPVIRATKAWLKNQECFQFWSWANEREGRATLYATRDLADFSNRHLDEDLQWGASHVAARFGLWGLMPSNVGDLRAAINSTTRNGDTPLMIAAERGHVDFVRVLLANPATMINETDVDGNTALCRAVYDGQLAAAQTLLAEGSGVNATLGTPLHAALQLAKVNITRALLSCPDLDINAFPIMEENADIMTREELENWRLIIRSLAEELGIRGERHPRDRCLSWAFTYDSLYLGWLDNGLDGRMWDEIGDTVLHDAARRENGDGRVRQLLARGLPVDVRSRDGVTALGIAAHAGVTNTVKLLLSLGADVNAQDDDGWTPLHFAARAGQVEITKILLESGATLNAKNNSGLSPVQAAAWSGNTEAVLCLYEHGADCLAKTRDGGSLLLCSVQGGDMATVQRVLEMTRPEDVNGFPENGVSPLIHACLAKRLDLVTLLVDNGAKVDLADESGYTALHAAAAKNSEDIVDFLLKHGANPNAADEFMGTPYTTSVENMASVRKLLLDHGGDPFVEGGYGWTPAEIFHCIGILPRELGNLTDTLRLVSSGDETRPRQIKRLKALIDEALRSTMAGRYHPWQFRLLGRVLALVGNITDAETAFERLLIVPWGTNVVSFSNGFICQLCRGESMTGSAFVCAPCIVHPALFDQFSPQDVFNSGGRDAQWAAFLDVNGFMDLRYSMYRVHDQNDVKTPQGREERILSMLLDKITEDRPDTPTESPELLQCKMDHKFVCVPGRNWSTLAEGTVNTKGQTVEEWLKGLRDRYEQEDEPPARAL
ncbi:hypothetical protein QBC34DRAFT_495090 [Podospora aff. communis PSN243]|uniref:Fungal N-terminal domain-containing protein n=1 Tax=Podospora aff. communis PSN243 TaxID=3040156 RepID=A0AAV9GL92_9PEZI|nr:hypothetical protein QBC34DRAFT_495090 [Podospora aff. communis PSN243]